MPKAGEQVGDFALVREVGRGAMGVVWEARQGSLDRTVAVKFLSGSIASDETWVARFKAEAGQAGRLSHPGILPVYAVGEHEGLPWYAMELVAGEDLARRLAREGRFDPREAARLARDAALALQHAHDHGVVHRDVKPANLMVREDGRLVVTDFGLAKHAGSGALTTTGLLVGTPYYMSPEQVAGSRTIGPSADVYGLGATLYELLLGKPPFLAENPVALVKRIAEEEPTPPSRLRRDLPRDLETVVLACLAKRPERRYPSMAELAADLDRFLRGDTVSRRRPGLNERVARFTARHRGAFLVAGVAVLLLGAAFAWFGEELGSLEEERSETARLLADAERLLSEGREEEAAETVERAQEVEGATPKDREAARGFAARTVLGNLVLGRPVTAEQRRRLREWVDASTGTLALDVEPPDAVRTAFRLPGPAQAAPLALEAGEANVKAGIWRVHLAAEGRVPTVVTLALPPDGRMAVRVAMPRAVEATSGFVHYAGVWLPAPGSGTTRLVEPFFLARSPVPGTRGIGALQAESRARALGARLPTEAELTVAAVPLLAADPPEDRPENPLEAWALASDLLARAEGLEALGRAPEWTAEGAASRKPWHPALALGGRSRPPRPPLRPESVERNVVLRLARSPE